MSEPPFFLAFVRNGERGEAEKRAEKGGRESDDNDVRRIDRFNSRPPARRRTGCKSSVLRLSQRS